MKELNECTIEELKELARKGQRFETMINEWNNTASDLLNLSEKLKEISSRINPLAFVKDKIRNKRDGDVKDILQDLYSKMTQGTYVTRHLLETMFPDKDYAWVGNRLKELQSMSGVETTRDGKTIRLFYKD